MKAFLLAAGVGSRLRPITDYIPKCMLVIDDRPLLDTWLDAEVGPEELEKLTSKMSRLSEEQARQVLEQVQKQS